MNQWCLYAISGCTCIKSRYVYEHIKKGCVAEYSVRLGTKTQRQIALACKMVKLMKA